MAKVSMWESHARYVSDVYGAHVDWYDRFYECPECGEPIFECDWTEDELCDAYCPVCGFDEEDAPEDDCDYEVGYDPYMGCFTDDC